MTTTTFNSTKDFDFEEQLNEQIHLHLKARTGRKCLTIIDGLTFDTEADSKKFLKLAQTKFATSGCKKQMVEYNATTAVYCFSGDRRYDFVELIKAEYNKPDSVFKVHG
jgi:translation initiation factor 1 (eIF-1/SUI1)